MGVFFDEPAKAHYLIEISRKSKLAHTSTKQHLEKLIKMSIIEQVIEKKGKRTFPIYKANLDNNEYKFYKVILNRIRLKESGLIDFLIDKLMPDSIILFGSYANGEDMEGSDIDLFLECKKTGISLEKFEKELKRKIQFHFKENFKEYPKELKNNIVNGIVLYGYIEVF